MRYIVRLDKSLNEALREAKLTWDDEPFSQFTAFEIDPQWDDERCYSIKYLGKWVNTKTAEDAQVSLETIMSEWGCFINGNWEYD